MTAASRGRTAAAGTRTEKRPEIRGTGCDVAHGRSSREDGGRPSPYMVWTDMCIVHARFAFVTHVDRENDNLCSFASPWTDKMKSYWYCAMLIQRGLAL